MPLEYGYPPPVDFGVPMTRARHPLTDALIGQPDEVLAGVLDALVAWHVHGRSIPVIPRSTAGIRDGAVAARSHREDAAAARAVAAHHRLEVARRSRKTAERATVWASDDDHPSGPQLDQLRRLERRTATARAAAWSAITPEPATRR